MEASGLEHELATLDAQGFVVLPGLLSPAECEEVRAALAPHLDQGLLGRNPFEGHRTERVYALVGLGGIFERTALHPRVLALCDRWLQPGYLLTASQAIRIHPGEKAQDVHFDDAFYPIPRPRAPVSMSTIWAVDAFTERNGATEIWPGSHRLGDAEVANTYALNGVSATTRGDFEGKLVTATMPAGSCIVFLGTLLHRGGANRSDAPRLAFSHQYCQPWARQQENYFLAIPRERAEGMPERLQAMLGYSVHPPFMGHARGLHPRRWLDGKL
ncbi:MAG TPA: phytanoyl-CoA dioxygenase family protein [Myxococcota bacterium]|nr:phytanoyl-CoA dioxygenase family protein [Myxococcota bacterium]